jgi:hypothetical protein
MTAGSSGLAAIPPPQYFHGLPDALHIGMGEEGGDVFLSTVALTMISVESTFTGSGGFLCYVAGNR